MMETVDSHNLKPSITVFIFMKWRCYIYIFPVEHATGEEKNSLEKKISSQAEELAEELAEEQAEEQIAIDKDQVKQDHDEGKQGNYNKLKHFTRTLDEFEV